MISLSSLCYRVPFWRPMLYGGQWALPDIPATQGKVLLSFDDGPTDSTGKVLDILADQKCRAIFFLKAELLPLDPVHPESELQRKALGITRRILPEGHLPACHGLKHHRLALRSPSHVRRELSQAKERIQAACGFAPIHFRPPYGNWAPWLNSIPARTGMQLMFWSLNPMDYSAKCSDHIVQRATKLVRQRDLILLHCSGPGQGTTLGALPDLIQSLRDRELDFLDPSVLMETSHV